MKKLDVNAIDEQIIRFAFMDNLHLIEYKTIGGNLAIVITKMGGGDCPWLGFYYATDKIGGEWIPAAWTDRGKVLSISKSKRPYYPLDLDILEDQPQLA